MLRLHEFNVSKGVLVSPARILSMSLLYALFLHPTCNLCHADHRCPGTLCNRYRVPQVIAMCMGKQDIVRVERGRIIHRQRVIRQEGIDDD